MNFTILGCGTSTGVPIIHCTCAVCQSTDPKNNRLRASIWVETQGKSFLIDTSTDFRQQALRTRIPRIDAVLYTHPHADHIHGIDELRTFNYVQKEKIPVYGNEWTCRDLNTKFSYIFKPGIVLGGAIPQLELNQFDTSVAYLDILGVKVIPISLEHGNEECVGYRFESMAYVTDCNRIPPQSLARLTSLSVLVLDCVRLQSHRTHFNLEQALKTIEELKPEKTFLTHLGHDFDYSDWSKKLPKGVFLAYDGLVISS